MKENRTTTCDPCEQDFKHKVDELVREGKAPSHMERAKREHEVKSAFVGAGTGAGKPGAKPHPAAEAPKMKK